MQVFGCFLHMIYRRTTPSWVCSAIDQRRRQNMMRTSVTHSAAPCVPHFFWYHILKSYVVIEQTHGNMESIYLNRRKVVQFKPSDFLQTNKPLFVLVMKISNTYFDMNISLLWIFIQYSSSKSQGNQSPRFSKFVSFNEEELWTKMRHNFIVTSNMLT